MLRPIAEPADVAHKILCHSVLMMRNEISNDLIEEERSNDDHRDNDDAYDPIKKRPTLHK